MTRGAAIADWGGAGLLAFGLAGAAWVQTARFRPDLPYRFGVGLEEPAAGAAAFLDRAGVSGRMFNEYGLGGYLMWRCWPRRRVFIDGRNLEYGPVLAALALKWHRPENWAELDGRFKFDYAVISVQPGAYTARVLDEDPAWRPAYWDDSALVYLRRTRENGAALAAHGYEVLQPGRSNYQYLAPALADPKKRQRLLAELDRAVSEAPGCGNAKLLKAAVLIQLGRAGEARPLVEETVRLFPRQAQPRFTLGWLAEAAGDAAGAAAHYDAALRLVRPGERPGLGADILNNLGAAAERRGEPAAARRSYEAALRWNPGQGDARRNLERVNAMVR